jgi:putative ABC transport system substrate-binding protein
MKRVGMFMNLPDNDQDMPGRKDAFLKGLAGWTIGKDLELAYRYGAAEHPKYPDIARELVALEPDVLFASCGPSFWALRRALEAANKDIPIVFAGMIDAVNAARIASIQSDSDNFTGYISYDSKLCVKWLDLLKRIVPQVTRVAVIRDTHRPAGMTQYHAILNAAGTFGVVVSPIEVGDSPDEIERAVAAFASAPDGGLIVPAGTLTATRRQLIIGLAAKHRLPAVYPNRIYINSGGLIAYGAITLELYESAAGYVDRILKGARAPDLPRVWNANFETVINRATAKALGLDLSAFLRPERIVEIG